jgi:hypothetical protein
MARAAAALPLSIRSATTLALEMTRARRSDMPVSFVPSFKYICWSSRMAPDFNVHTVFSRTVQRYYV